MSSLENANHSIIEYITELKWRCLCFALSLSRVWLFVTPWSPSGSSVHGDSPGKNTEVGCHFLLQGIYPTQGLNPGLVHCRQDLSHLSHQGSWGNLYFIVFEWYFTEYTVLDCQFFFFLFPLSPLKMLYHFLPFILSSGRSAVIWMFVLMYKLWVFLLFLELYFYHWFWAI